MEPDAIRVRLHLRRIGGVAVLVDLIERLVVGAAGSVVDETSLRRGHRYVTVVINGDTGEALGIVAHRNTPASRGFWWVRATIG